MGAGQSAEEDDGMLDVMGKEYGFRVHRVEPGSPGHATLFLFDPT